MLLASPLCSLLQNAVSGVENIYRVMLSLGLDMTIVFKDSVYLLCILLIMLLLLKILKTRNRNRYSEGEDFDQTSDMELLQELSSQTVTLFSDCLDHLGQLEKLTVNSHAASSSVNSQCNDSSDSECSMETKASQPQPHGAQLPSGSRHCLPLQLWENSGRNDQDIRAEPRDFNRDATGSGRENKHSAKRLFAGPSDSESPLLDDQVIKVAPSVRDGILQSDFQDARTHFIPQDYNDAPENLIKLSVTQRRWDLLSLAVRSVREFKSQGMRSKYTLRTNNPPVFPTQDADSLNEQTISVLPRESLELNNSKLFFSIREQSMRALFKPGTCITLPRVKHILFMNHEAISLIEMTQRKKHLESLFGVPTIFTDSTELLEAITSKAALLLSQKAASLPNVNSEFKSSDSEIPFVSQEIRDDLEFHIKRKQILHQLGLSEQLAGTLKAPTTTAHKVTSFKLSSPVRYQIQVMTGDLSFLTKQRVADLEENVTRKKAHRNLGYPTRVFDSLKVFALPEAIAIDLGLTLNPPVSPSE